MCFVFLGLSTKKKKKYEFFQLFRDQIFKQEEFCLNGKKNQFLKHKKSFLFFQIS